MPKKPCAACKLGGAKARCFANKQLSAKYAAMAKFLKVIGDDNRLRILCLLQKGERCVCEIYPGLDLPQNLVSSHLKVMLEFGLLVVRQEGKKNYYAINPRTFKKYNSLLIDFLKDYEKRD